ncbi:hypothetical protein BS50DRAFT_588836 [Corynespora cassiicola Philippines]|uniref:Cell wall protein YJL171C/Tos1 C-terminal domain-containing protein n=1 Tax=Corynespora cassiicola Philippines TaxID=1448308 RepID=A0A2T2NKV7_CORCC|nr:hypothetical protein BS50DRAFT_588836 [Corynespora cassiicola Philippines]
MTFKLIALLSLAAAAVAAPAPVGGGLGAAGEGTKCSFDVSITEVCHASTIEGYAEVLPIDSPEGVISPNPTGGLITWNNPVFLKVQGKGIDDYLSIFSPRANGINPEGVIYFGWKYNNTNGNAIHNWNEYQSKDMDFGCNGALWNDPKPKCSNGGSRVSGFGVKISMLVILTLPSFRASDSAAGSSASNKQIRCRHALGSEVVRFTNVNGQLSRRLKQLLVGDLS